jgi:hypothetical protein
MQRLSKWGLRRFLYLKKNPPPPPPPPKKNMDLMDGVDFLNFFDFKFGLFSKNLVSSGLKVLINKSF